MTTSFFFFINGYIFGIPDDSPEFTVSIVETAAREGTLVEDEITRIANWLQRWREGARPKEDAPTSKIVIRRNRNEVRE